MRTETRRILNQDWTNKVGNLPRLTVEGFNGCPGPNWTPRGYDYANNLSHWEVLEPGDKGWQEYEHEPLPLTAQIGDEE